MAEETLAVLVLLLGLAVLVFVLALGGWWLRGVRAIGRMAALDWLFLAWLSIAVLCVLIALRATILALHHLTPVCGAVL